MMKELMSAENLAVIADDIAELAQFAVQSRDYKSIENMANNLATMIRIHVIKRDEFIEHVKKSHSLPDICCPDLEYSE